MEKQLRILARTLVVDNDKVLLVRNRGEDYWYLPGGGWEYDRETITQCASREVTEETGYEVAVDRMLWLQEFHKAHQVFFETFWLASISESNNQTSETLRSHIDHDPEGMVEEARWYSESELTHLIVYPERVKRFSQYITNQADDTDPFIGTFL